LRLTQVGFSEIASAPARALLALALFLILSSASHAQPLSGTDEHLAGDRPEAWAMNYFAGTTLFTGFGVVPELAPWRSDLTAEFGHIPRLSDDQRRIGFNGTKVEDLNKSPVFGRIRLTLGLPGAWVGEFAFTPPIEINGAHAHDLVALAFGRRLIERGPWVLSARAFGQYGSVRGDITCPERLANVADPVANPYDCRAASRDRFNLHYYGADTTATWRTGAWRLSGGIGLVRTDLDVRVDALTDGVRDVSHLTTRGYLRCFTLGAAADVNTKWSIGSEVLYVPLHVRRNPTAARESDPLTSVRLQIRYRID
jgi:hypothetical protein